MGFLVELKSNSRKHRTLLGGVLGVHPIKITPPPYLVAGVSLDDRAMDFGVVVDAATQTSSLGERKNVFAEFIPTEVATGICDEFPHGLTKSSKSWIGRWLGVVLAAWMMIAHHVSPIAAPVAALAKRG
jgi:hypothetical protein